MPRGPDLWKFNNSLLADTVFSNFVSACISDLSDCISHLDLVKAWWDFFKESLKQDIILFANNKCKFAFREPVVLNNRLIELKQRLVQGDDFLSSEIASLESRLKTLVFIELEGAKIRSKVQWLEDGEKPTCFFFKLEREHFKKNNLTSILDEHDKVFAHEEIECAHVSFFPRSQWTLPVNNNVLNIF